MTMRILFVCVGNAGRSQMAEAFAKKYGGNSVEVSSAGTAPSRKLHPEVVQALQEVGMDISKNTPKALDLKIAEKADVIVTMGCSLEGLCPAPLLKRSVDWGLEDPMGKPLDKVREIRDVIEQRVRALLTGLHE